MEGIFFIHFNRLDLLSHENDSDTDSDPSSWAWDEINWLSHLNDHYWLEATWAWQTWSWHQQDWHGHYWQGASSGYQPQNQPHPLGSFGVAPLAPPQHPLGSFGVAPLAPPQTVVPNASGPVPRGQFGAAPVPQDAPGNPFPVVPQAAPPPPAHDKGDLGNEWFDCEEGELESEEGSDTEITNRGSKGYEPQDEP